jgi:ferredoxin
MARMKFLCDAERCIECNGCVTACKQEHEIPWGVNRRRVVTINDGVPGERSISGRLHALLRRAVHGRLPGRLLLQDRGRRGPARQGPVHRLRLLLLRVPVRRAAVPAGGRVRRARQDGQVHVLRRRPRAQTTRKPSSRSTAATASPRASCRRAPRCARPRRCWAATATCSRTSTARASPCAARAATSGAGPPRTASRARLPCLRRADAAPAKAKS